MSVSPAAAAALAADKVRAVVVRHIVNYLSALGILDKRSLGNENYQVLCGRAVELGTLAVLSVLRDKFMLILKCEERIRARINTENYVSAMTTVSAVRSAVRNVFLASEGHRAISAVSRFYKYSYVIYKHTLPQSIPYSFKMVFHSEKS